MSAEEQSPEQVLEAAKQRLSEVPKESRVERESILRRIHTEVTDAMDAINPAAAENEDDARRQRDLIESLEDVRTQAIALMRRLDDEAGEISQERLLKSEIGELSGVLYRLVVLLNDRESDRLNPLIETEYLEGISRGTNGLRLIGEEGGRLNTDEFQAAVQILTSSFAELGQARTYEQVREDPDSLRDLLDLLPIINSRVEPVIQRLTANGGAEKFGLSPSLLRQLEEHIDTAHQIIRRKFDAIEGYGSY